MLTTFIAHAGHAGDHGWLSGAAQPLLSVDHFLAALFVVVAVALGAMFAAKAARVRDVTTRSL